MPERSKRATANRVRARAELVKTIEKLKITARTSSLVAAHATTEGASADAPRKAVGILLDELPEAFYSIVEKNSEHVVEMQCTPKTLERLLFYLNFYRQPTDAVAPLRETAQSLARAGQKTIRVVAFRTTILQQSIDSEFLDNLSFRKKLFLTTDPLEVFDLERLLFIESSRALLDHGNLRCFESAPGLRALTRLLKLKRWILANFSEEDVRKFLLVGSTVLFSFGVRIPNDIDLYIHNDLQNRSLLVRRVKKALKTAPQGVFSSIDIILRGFGQWQEGKGVSDYFNKLWSKLAYEWPKSFGARDMSEVLDNPQFHYYFLGLKCVSLQGDIERRVRSTRPASYADLLYMQRMQEEKRLADTLSITISALTEYVYAGNRWLLLSNEERHRYYERICKSLKSRYGISMRVEEIREVIDRGSYVEPFNYPTTRES